MISSALFSIITLFAVVDDPVSAVLARALVGAAIAQNGVPVIALLPVPNGIAAMVPARLTVGTGRNTLRISGGNDTVSATPAERVTLVARAVIRIANTTGLDLTDIAAAVAREVIPVIAFLRHTRVFPAITAVDALQRSGGGALWSDGGKIGGIKIRNELNIRQ